VLVWFTSCGYPAAIRVPRLVTISSLSDFGLTLHVYSKHSSKSAKTVDWTFRTSTWYLEEDSCSQLLENNVCMLPYGVSKVKTTFFKAIQKVQTVYLSVFDSTTHAVFLMPLMKSFTTEFMMSMKLMSRPWALSCTYTEMGQTQASVTPTMSA